MFLAYSAQLTQFLFSSSFGMSCPYSDFVFTECLATKNLFHTHASEMYEFLCQNNSYKELIFKYTKFRIQRIW
jgi:hypothetical protein